MEFYNEFLSRFSISGKQVKDLSRFSRLCEALGNPQHGQRFIHVAGTNGKGSISEYIGMALIAGGQKTGKFTSPYILEFNERIKIDYEDIDDADLSEIMKRIANAVEKLDEENYSRFELLTVAAFIYFKEKNVDVSIIETGIGGRFDCTNIITPIISVISKVDFDHREILGDKKSQIAWHKAGIIKTGVPCVASPNSPEIIKVLNSAVKEVGAPELIFPDESELKIKEISVFGNNFTYKGIYYNTTMGGKHQIVNAITAIEVLQQMDVSSMAIKQGLNTAVLKARMQVISGSHPTVIIDGAHNVGGIKAAAELVSCLPCKKVIVFGMLDNKDFTGALAILARMADEFILTDDFDPRARKVGDFLIRLSELRFDKNKIHLKKSSNALEFAKKRAEEGLVLSCGSLYLAGRLLK